MQYLLNLSQLIAIFAISGLSLRVLVGQVGLLSLAQAAFMSIGAYTTALLASDMGAGAALALPAAATTAFSGAFLLSFPLLRLRGDYFVLATLAAQAIIVNLSKNLKNLTNGTQGIADIPPVSGIGAQSLFPFIVYCTLAITAISLLWVERTGLGTQLRAIRDNEDLAKALGRNTPLTLRITFAITASFAGLAGGLYAYHIRYLDPDSFSLTESVLLLTIVILGGVNRVLGAILGALILVGLPELLRFLPLPDQIAANGRQMLLGLLLVAFVMMRPSDLRRQEI